MTTINISLKDLLNVASATTIKFTLVGAVFTVNGAVIKPNSIKTVTTASDGTATVSLSTGNYLVQVGSVKWTIGVTGTGTADLIDLVDIRTPTPIQRGVPAGGDNGQVLGKNSDNDYDTQWLDVVLTENNFTTALKNAYDSVVTWISTNGANILNHVANLTNPHGVTKSQVGLGSVDNTSDLGKPVSTATQTALDLKASILGTQTLQDKTLARSDNTSATGIYGGSGDLNGAYLNVTGKDYNTFPGKGSAEFIVGQDTGAHGVRSVFKIVSQDYAGGFTDRLTVIGSTGAVNIPGTLTAGNLSNTNTGDNAPNTLYSGLANDSIINSLIFG
jgi:hypothetical protein